MPLEIEKKYRLSPSQKRAVTQRLSEIGAKLKGTEFEENTLYTGEALEPSRSALRLRRIGKRAILTYKERFPGKSSVKQQQEDETDVGDPEALDAILQALGFQPSIVYEKRRTTWRLRGAEVVVDELPFGQYMEIEGSEARIADVERKLAVKGLAAEEATYPSLTVKYGNKRHGVVEARFKSQKARSKKRIGT